MTKPKPKHLHDPVGRPTIMTEERVNKLEQAFSFGCSDLEACLYADISKQTLYNYQKKNPEFVDRKQRLKETPILAARESVIKHMKDDGNLALKYLERKRKKEFGLHSTVEHEGGMKLQHEMTTEEKKKLKTSLKDVGLEL